MRALIKVEDVIETPMGWAVTGTNPTRADLKQNLVSGEFEDLQKNSNPLEFIAYETKSGNMQKLRIKDFEMTSNMSNTSTLNILFDEIPLPEEIKPGTPIYRA